MNQMMRLSDSGLVGNGGVVLRALANGGVAETPHIHIEALLSDTPYDLTVFFEHVQPPLSQEEVERLLSR